MPDTPLLHQERLEQLERLAGRMDKAFRLPVIGTRIGWDSILGLVPGIGDTLTLLPAGYILVSAHRMGVPKATLARMAANTGIDALIGSIPLVGDIFDIGWKANSRNVALLRRHLEREAETREPLAKRMARKAHPGSGRSHRTPPRAEQAASDEPRMRMH